MIPGGRPRGKPGSLSNRAVCIVPDLEGDPACPTREDKARRFTQLMGTAEGAPRATFFRLRLRLE